MVKNTQKLILSSNMYPNYYMKTLDSNSEKVGVSWSEGLSYTVLGYQSNLTVHKFTATKLEESIVNLLSG